MKGNPDCGPTYLDLVPFESLGVRGRDNQNVLLLGLLPPLVSRRERGRVCPEGLSARGEDFRGL